MAAKTTPTNRISGKTDGNGKIEPTSFREMVESMKVIAFQDEVELARLRIHLVGLPPGFLQHSRRGMDENYGKGKPDKNQPKPTPEEMAEFAAYYVDPDAKTKQLALPWRCLYNAMVAAAVNYKLDGNKTYMDVVASSVACEQDNIPLILGGKAIRKYVVKRDWARIPPRTGGVVPIGRALVPEWEVEFDLIIDPFYFGANAVELIGKILMHAGKQKGVGVWSPRLKGPYGKFRVANCEFIEFINDPKKKTAARKKSKR